LCVRNSLHVFSENRVVEKVLRKLFPKDAFPIGQRVNLGIFFASPFPCAQRVLKIAKIGDYFTRRVNKAFNVEDESFTGLEEISFTSLVNLQFQPLEP